jgi:hypothetical protein
VKDWFYVGSALTRENAPVTGRSEFSFNF